MKKEESFPVAEVSRLDQTASWTLSRMWLLTLACLAIAIGLTWYSRERPGKSISIRFDEGHGLKEGDSLRHRGIEIGRVSAVHLAEDFSGIEVEAVLDPKASGIANKDSRFWIVRPQIDMSGIRGLDTAIGSKYVAVSPGQSLVQQSVFLGLASHPFDSLGSGGVEITLRGELKHGIHPGAPLTWRGVEVGQVLSSNLSPDAMHVDTRVRIEQAHRRLLSSASKFWVTSGVQMELDVTGLELKADSLSTIVRGGVAFITPKSDSSPNQEVVAGDMFTLHAQLDEKWLDDAAPINLLELVPPPVHKIRATWKQKFFGISRSMSATATSLAIQDGDMTAFVVPADIMDGKDEAIEGSYRLSLIRGEETKPLDVSSTIRWTKKLWKLPIRNVSPAEVVATERLRSAVQAEDCFAIVRQLAKDSATVVEMIGENQIQVTEEGWICSDTRLSREVWHGVPVVASNDERIIGVLSVSKDGIEIAPFPR